MGDFDYEDLLDRAREKIPNEISNEIDGWSIEILRDKCIATMQKEALFDQNSKIMRG